MELHCNYIVFFSILLEVSYFISFHCSWGYFSLIFPSHTNKPSFFFYSDIEVIGIIFPWSYSKEVYSHMQTETIQVTIAIPNAIPHGMAQPSHGAYGFNIRNGWIKCISTPSAVSNWRMILSKINQKQLLLIHPSVAEVENTISTKHFLLYGP